MRIPLVDLKTQYNSVKPEIDKAIQNVIDQTDFISGPEIGIFENNFSNYLKVKETVGVASGTAALQLALLALGIRSGDEVITTAHTFAATAEAIVHVGATPVFVDIKPDTYLIDPKQIDKAITSKTKAIIVVHLYGLAAEMNEILEIAESHNLRVVEDAAQAHGAKYFGRNCGSIGDIGCFSFYPGKNLGSFGDAGAVTSNCSELIAMVRKLHDHGRSAKYTHEIVGYGERLDTIQAAILDVKLKHLDEWNELRRKHANTYSELLKGLPVLLPHVPEGLEHIYHQYVIRTTSRDDLLNYLKSFGIGVGIHYPTPLHKQPAFQKFVPDSIKLPIVESCADEILSLPMYPELTDEQIYFVGTKISEFFKK